MKAAIASHKLVAVIVVVVVALAAIIGAVTYTQYQQEQDAQRAIELQTKTQAHEAYSCIEVQPADIKQAFYFYLVEDDFGNAVPRADLDRMEPGLFDKLIAAYNADPACEKPLSADDARWGLTDGLLEVMGTKSDQGGKNSAQYAFLLWCGDDADLVYNDASVAHNFTPGETATSSGAINNYSYILGQNLEFSNYQYRWEWNNQHPEDPR